MDFLPGKTFALIKEDLLCEYKTIEEPVYSASPDSTEPAIMHNHNGYEMLLLLGGEVNFYIGEYGRRLTPGQLICINPYDFHMCEMIDVNEYDRIVVNISEPLMNSLSTDKTDLTDCFVRNGRFNVIQLSEDAVESFRQYSFGLIDALSSDEYGSDIMAETYARQILVLANRQSSEGHAASRKEMSIMPELVSETIRYIDRHLQEEFSIQMLADHLHHNSSYVSRCFKQFAGISLQEFIINKKISLAQRYLRDQVPPCDVCFMVGFRNYSNFSRTFSKYSGVSPKQYQRLQAPDVTLPGK
ncbi:helix-turn-helix domain-containing protein [Butyrivibrio sp. MC2013]|uniref:helix-turn-helix domain-containing protein n=1 Tax=Butyrivibrio sp. MC2013 TaxID=1280686 RepID=UPI000684F4A5|nr:AraC family transcriptional regulator [Butyrivibrio sp. MC2013]